MRFNKVLLPLPVEPIIATVSPLPAVNDIFSRTYSVASGYLNETFLNSNLPFSSDVFIFPSFIFDLVLNTSLILFA